MWGIQVGAARGSELGPRCMCPECWDGPTERAVKNHGEFIAFSPLHSEYQTRMWSWTWGGCQSVSQKARCMTEESEKHLESSRLICICPSPYLTRKRPPVMATLFTFQILLRFLSGYPGREPFRESSVKINSGLIKLPRCRLPDLSVSEL